MRKGLRGVVQSGFSSARATVPKANSTMRARSRRNIFRGYHVVRRMAVWIRCGKLEGTGLLQRGVDVADEVADVAAAVEQGDHGLFGGVACGRVVGVLGGVPLRPECLELLLGVVEHGGEL